jgi:predicted MPP superfamily phosphohydrolase
MGLLGTGLVINIFRDIARSVTKAAGLGVGEIEFGRERLELPAWPRELAGMRVAVVADLHAGGPQIDEERIDRIVERVSAEAVDLVALLGDYIDPTVAFGKWIEPEKIGARLGRIESRLGTYAVLGNHDWSHAGARMGEALRDAGIELLENRAVKVGADEAGATPASARAFWIAGLGDLTKREADLDGTLAQVRDSAPVLLFSHNPDVFPDVPPRVALTLSGHTHGAQVDVPVLRDKLTPSRFGARYTGGHIEEGGRHLYVSDGIGTSRLPIRFRAKSSLPVIELQPSTSASH